jgi:hypothetical protein
MQSYELPQKTSIAFERVRKLRIKLHEAEIELQAVCPHPAWSGGTSYHECMICHAPDSDTNEERLKRWQDVKANSKQLKVHK